MPIESKGNNSHFICMPYNVTKESFRKRKIAHAEPFAVELASAFYVAQGAA